MTTNWRHWSWRMEYTNPAILWDCVYHSDIQGGMKNCRVMEVAFSRHDSIGVCSIQTLVNVLETKNVSVRYHWNVHCFLKHRQQMYISTCECTIKFLKTRTKTTQRGQAVLRIHLRWWGKASTNCPPTTNGSSYSCKVSLIANFIEACFHWTWNAKHSCSEAILVNRTQINHWMAAIQPIISENRFEHRGEAQLRKTFWLLSWDHGSQTTFETMIGDTIDSFRNTRKFDMQMMTFQVTLFIWCPMLRNFFAQ